MSGNILTPQATPAADHPATRGNRLAPRRAARELGLKRSEFDIAMGLGRIRVVPDEGGGGPCVTRAEIERVREQEGFPESLRERVRTVGTTEGAALMKVPTSRFARLARLGLLVPVKVYVNRYGAVVWLYLADELRQFASDESNAALLTGRAPERLRLQLKDGQDRRPRNWRRRHLGFLLRRTDDPWARAAAVASLLDPVEIEAVVGDPHERSHLQRLRPAPVIHGAPGSPSARLAEEIMTATDPDEIHWLRAELAHLVGTAREHHTSAPRPTARPAAHRVPRAAGHHCRPSATTAPSSAAQSFDAAGIAPRHTPTPSTTALGTTRPSGVRQHPSPAPERRRGLLGRLRRRNPRPTRPTR
ncbi:hypothetical protein J7I94_00435 [Streptomyces sp. ISL-12]|uniref:DUF6397 family protein n=1 Tax=Streptomyces sp. ISL-12 TaxID=2819177 RepID=UPI001BE850EB|nr:DUF6397 family protein [Streptomyces sp. ISL-12]MBT2409038.1 hypothetical protein [Streptomyces sp. ISL-12]